MDLFCLLLILYCLDNRAGRATCVLNAVSDSSGRALILVHLLDCTAICLAVGVIWRAEWSQMTVVNSFCVFDSFWQKKRERELLFLGYFVLSRLLCLLSLKLSLGDCLWAITSNYIKLIQHNWVNYQHWRFITWLQWNWSFYPLFSWVFTNFKQIWSRDGTWDTLVSISAGQRNHWASLVHSDGCWENVLSAGEGKQLCGIL